jgi:hypothetical protein
MADTPSATITIANPFMLPASGGISPVFKGVCRIGANR